MNAKICCEPSEHLIHTESWEQDSHLLWKKEEPEQRHQLRRSSIIYVPRLPQIKQQQDSHEEVLSSTREVTAWDSAVNGESGPHYSGRQSGSVKAVGPPTSLPAAPVCPNSTMCSPPTQECLSRPAHHIKDHRQGFSSAQRSEEEVRERSLYSTRRPR